MRVFGEKHARFCSTTTYAYLKSININVAYYRVLNNNRHVALSSMRGNIIHGVNEMVVTECQKEPLWKQDMHMRMGMKPKQVQYQRVLRLQEISPEEAKSYKFEVYEVRV